MRQRALKNPGRRGAALDATLQISYKWGSLPKPRFCGTTSLGEILLEFVRSGGLDMREHVIAAIPGDGIGPAVIPAGLQALQALEKRTGGFRLKVEEFAWGSDYYRKNGAMMPADALDRLRRFDAIFTRQGVTRIMRFAFRLARARPRKLLTVVTKSNAQRHGMVLWDEIAAEVSKEFPEVACDKMLVDAMTTRMVGKPSSLDTFVATNLHADILSDLAAALAGSLGIAPTANVDPERRFPSMFEPIHGSAFDIAGKGIANPVGAFWTAALMLEHLGEKDAALRLMQAVERVTGSGLLTPDLGGKATTREVTAAVCDALHSSNT